jgi:hypothetical protein
MGSGSWLFGVVSGSVDEELRRILGVCLSGLSVLTERIKESARRSVQLLGESARRKSLQLIVTCFRLESSGLGSQLRGHLGLNHLPNKAPRSFNEGEFIR